MTDELPASTDGYSEVRPVFGLSAYLGAVGLIDRSLGMDFGGANLRFYTDASSMVGMEVLLNFDLFMAIAGALDPRLSR